MTDALALYKDLAWLCLLTAILGFANLVLSHQCGKGDCRWRDSGGQVKVAASSTL